MREVISEYGKAMVSAAIVTACLVLLTFLAGGLYRENNWLRRAAVVPEAKATKYVDENIMAEAMETSVPVLLKSVINCDEETVIFDEDVAWELVRVRSISGFEELAGKGIATEMDGKLLIKKRGNYVLDVYVRDTYPSIHSYEMSVR